MHNNPPAFVLMLSWNRQVIIVWPYDLRNRRRIFSCSTAGLASRS